MSDSAKKYLDLIAKHLQEHHAAVLVGAGFSRNADKLDPTATDSPLWSDIAEAFNKKLGLSTEEKITDPLKLADYVQLAFGRPELEQLLQKCVHEEDFKPSKIHTDLLRLPWTDIFTTNYDTLLEQAAKEIIERQFKIILNQEDLVGSAGITRIIKLHGSFPSARPFIINSENYRTYPQNFAPFLNTVQQSLLENTLCLIGFSGTDPNFQRWIGWIRDNLGKQNSPFIYLLQHRGSSDTERLWLQELNIIPVDLSEISEDKSIRSIYENGLRYLKQKLEENDIVEIKLSFTEPKWPPHIGYKDFDKDSDLPIKNLEILRQIHKTYPGWLIPPQNNLAEIQQLMQANAHWLPSSINSLTPLLAAEYLYEYDWLRDTALLPLLNDERKKYQNILDYIIKNNNYDNDQKTILNRYLISIQISVLSSFRQSSDWNEWTALHDSLLKQLDLFQGDQIHQISWEECLCARDQYNFELLTKRLHEWKVPSSSPQWALRKGGILAEVGLFQEATESIKEAIHWIRLLPQEKQLHPRVTSVESPLMLLNEVLEEVRLERKSFWSSKSNTQNELINNEKRLDACELLWQQEEQKENRDCHENKQIKEDAVRKLKHNHYGVSWWEQNKWFVTRLPEIQNFHSKTITKGSFDFGKNNIIQSFGRNNDLFIAFAFLDFREKTGIPFRVSYFNFDKKAAVNAAERIALLQPLRSILTIIRANVVEKIDSVLTRGILSNWSTEQVDERSIFFREAINQITSNLEDKDLFLRQNFIYLTANMLPQVLSELCCKCSSEELEKQLNLAKKIYTSPSWRYYHRVNYLLNRLVTSWPKARHDVLISRLLTFPCFDKTDEMRNVFFPDAIRYVNFRIKNISKELTTQVDKIFEEYNSYKNNETILFRLLVCSKIGILSKNQRKKLNNLIWKGSQLSLPKGWSSLIALELSESKNDNLVRRFCVHATTNTEDYCQSETISNNTFHLNELSYMAINWQNSFQKEEVSKILNSLCKRINFLISFTDKNINLMGSHPTAKDQVWQMLFILWILTCDRKNWIPTKEDCNTMKDILVKTENQFHHYGLARYWKTILHMPNEPITNLSNSLRSGDENKCWWHYQMIVQAITFHKKNLLTKKETLISINTIAQHIAWRAPCALSTALETAKLVTEKQSNLLDAKNLDLILEGLSILANETRIQTDDSTDIASRKGETRKAAAALAKCLYYHKPELADRDALIKWEQIWNDPNEFAEIRNA